VTDTETINDTQYVSVRAVRQFKHVTTARHSSSIPVTASDMSFSMARQLLQVTYAVTCHTQWEHILVTYTVTQCQTANMSHRQFPTGE